MHDPNPRFPLLMAEYFELLPAHSRKSHQVYKLRKNEGKRVPLTVSNSKLPPSSQCGDSEFLRTCVSKLLSAPNLTTTYASQEPHASFLEDGTLRPQPRVAPSPSLYVSFLCPCEGVTQYNVMPEAERKRRARCNTDLLTCHRTSVAPFQHWRNPAEPLLET